MHLGKGALSPETIKQISERGAVYAVTAPVTALLVTNIVSRRVVAFANEGMEAFHELKVEGFPAIIAGAHGEYISIRTEGESQ